MRLLAILAIGCSSGEEAPADRPPDKPKPVAPEPPDAAMAATPDALPDAAAPDAATAEAKKPAGAGSAEVQRGFPAELIRTIVMANVDQIRACYTDELAKRPGLDGTIGVTFVVGEDGSIVRSTTPIGDQVVGTCINAVIKTRSKFPKPAGGVTVTINYPFVFEPSE